MAKREKFIMTNSRRSAGDCSNKHYIKYMLGLKSRLYGHRKNLNVGTLVHAGIDVMYKAVRSGTIEMDKVLDGTLLQMALNHVRMLARKIGKDIMADEGMSKTILKRNLAIDFGLVEIYLEGFYNHIFLKEEYEIVQSEIKFELPIHTPSGRKSPTYFYAGKMDAIVRNIRGDNQLYLHEVKTSAAWDKNSERYLRIDDQISGYVWAAHQLNFDVKGVIYTVVKKTASRPKLLPKKDRVHPDGPYDDLVDKETIKQYLDRIREQMKEDPEHFFIRLTVQRNKAQIEAFDQRIYHAAVGLKDISIKQPYPQPSPMKCSFCDAFKLCENFSPEVIDQFYVRKTTMHEELVDDEDHELEMMEV